MFVSDERVVAVSFGVAAARLATLAHGGWLRTFSETVYDGGVEYLLRVSPLGRVPGASRLVRVRFAQPVYRDGTMTVGMRWEATGVTSGLFPALDADIRLSDDAGQSVRVTLTGSYRPPLGAVGAELDRLVLRTVATATIRTLLGRVAAALEGAPAEASDALTRWQPEPGTASAASTACGP